jgi:hypothetical protein
MIEPSFTALFSRSEVSIRRKCVKFPGDIVPLVAVLVLSE